MIEIYTDGACNPVTGQGGWAAVIAADEKQVFSGAEKATTSNRMEITAALEGLLHTPAGREITVYTDSQYVFGTMTKNWQRRANRDLWGKLDEAAHQRKVTWEWLENADTYPLHKEAHDLCTRLTNSGEAAPAAQTRLPSAAQLSHVDASGKPRMVDVSEKADTAREAVARGTVRMQPETLDLIRKGQIANGDVLVVAQLAGIMAAKQTPYLIPLCHNLLLTEVKVEFAFDDSGSAVNITSAVKSTGKTGVEMEALTAVAAAALTIYDMCKAVDRGMKIENIRLARKSGGKSGLITLE